MTGWAAAAVGLLLLAITTQRAAASLSDRQGPSNYILGISAVCSAESMNITVRMRHPFRGIVYSRGFPLECSTAKEQHSKLFHFLQQKAELKAENAKDTGNQVPLQPAREVMLSLPASECGIRVVPSKDGEGLWLQTSIVVQLDRHLQQAADQTRTASCHLPAKDSTSSLLLQPLQQQQHRTGRQFGEDIPSVDFAEASAASWQQQQQQQQQHWQQRARAVMEILSTAGRGRGRDPGVLAVGEEAALVVTSHLPAGVGSRVTDCFAHDGAGEGMERLSDARGCPTDRLILPQLREVRTGPDPAGHAATDSAASSGETMRDSGDFRDAGHSGDARDAAGNSYESTAEPSATLFRKRRKRAAGLSTHVAAAKFAAFKFPDRSRLHLRCQLQLCRGACPQDSCLTEKANTTRQERRVRKGEQGELLGRLQVFNSVEVLAPGIEVDDRLRLDELTAASGGPSVTATAEKTFCLSPPRMALALATLGSVLLCAVAAALYTLLRGHRRPQPLRALLRRHFQYLQHHGSHGSEASLAERNVLVRVQDSPFGQPLAAPSPPSPPLGQWQDKLFH